MVNEKTSCLYHQKDTRSTSRGRKSKSGFANPVFNTAFCQIVFGPGVGAGRPDFVFGLDSIYELCQYLNLDLGYWVILSYYLKWWNIFMTQTVGGVSEPGQTIG